MNFNCDLDTESMLTVHDTRADTYTYMQIIKTLSFGDWVGGLEKPALHRKQIDWNPQWHDRLLLSMCFSLVCINVVVGGMRFGGIWVLNISQVKLDVELWVLKGLWMRRLSFCLTKAFNTILSFCSTCQWAKLILKTVEVKWLHKSIKRIFKGWFTFTNYLRS